MDNVSKPYLHIVEDEAEAAPPPEKSAFVKQLKDFCDRLDAEIDMYLNL